MSRSRISAQTIPAAPAQREPPRLSYLAVFRASPLERINMIRQGIRASEAKRIIAELAIGQGAALKALNLSPATVNKKAKQGQILSPAESERVIGFANLVGQLEAVIEESGNPVRFDAVTWMSRWLNDPVPALGNARPIDLMDTMEGQALVSTTLAQLQSGAYA
jgi:putative toxin-antitoxin system antitoxin component (TIGR02293 family)